jgi:hypothetical protein
MESDELNSDPYRTLTLNDYIYLHMYSKGSPDFSRHNIPEWGKLTQNYQMDIKYLGIQNGRNLFKMG